MRKNVWTFSLRSEPGQDVCSLHPRSSAVLCPDIPLDQKKAVISAICRASVILCSKGMRADILPMPPAVVLFVEPALIQWGPNFGRNDDVSADLKTAIVLPSPAGMSVSCTPLDTDVLLACARESDGIVCVAYLQLRHGLRCGCHLLSHGGHLREVFSIHPTLARQHNSDIKISGLAPSLLLWRARFIMAKRFKLEFFRRSLN